jgi:hypothetical protein
MRWALALLLLAAPAFADAPKKSPAKPPAAAKAQPAPKPACKRRIVGKGLERKVVCVFEQELVITSGPPKPAVVIAPIDGRKVTGRPKLTDPLAGLPRRRSSAR